jgi:RNA polymerase primary sigma factor
VNDIGRVISRLEQQRATIDRALSALREIDAQKPSQSTEAPERASGSKPKKRRMSEEGRQRIIAAVRKRWAEKRAAEAQAGKSAAKQTSAKKSAPKKSAAKKSATTAT